MHRTLDTECVGDIGMTVRATSRYALLGAGIIAEMLPGVDLVVNSFERKPFRTRTQISFPALPMKIAFTLPAGWPSLITSPILRTRVLVPTN